MRVLKLAWSVLTARWFVGLIGASLLALVVWVFGPSVAINGYAPLASELGRLLAILGISLLWGASNLWTLQRTRAKGEAMAEALAEPAAAPADAELAAVAVRFKEEMARLKAHRFAKGRLYELPWYVMIGPPGSGKTTALLQSGLRFPLEGLQELKGIGGTRHCDWLFTDEAILIDTAGRWTMQDSDPAADEAAWLGFLDLLNQHRPREPINGVIVALAVDDLAAADPAGLEATARATRARLTELSARLGLSVPTYLLLTKADLIAGFRETFADLDERAREQVWGFTLPLTQPGSAPPGELVQRELDLLLDRLETRLLGRIEAENDPDRCALTQAFPLQVAALADPLRQFLDRAFGGTSCEAPPLLRGIYFTSGTQAGTPIDRLLSGLQQRFGLRLGPIRAQAGNRSFFLTRLLREVIFPEAPLVRRASRLERRERQHAQLAWGLTTTVVLLIVGGWILAYRAQTGAILAYADTVRAYRTQAAPVATDAVGPKEENLRQLVPVLDAAESLVETAPEPAASFGLSQTNRLRDYGAEVYSRALHDILLPRLVLLVEMRLRAELGQPEAAVGESLKVYLGLGGQGALPAASVAAWFAEDWLRAYPLDEALRDRLGRHLAALLEELPAAEVRPQLDGKLIRSALSAIDRMPLSKRAYLALARKHGAVGQAFEPLKVAGPEASALFPAGTGSALATSIPELFTRRGFWQRFLPAMVPEMQAAVAEHAAMRPGQPGLDEREQARLIREMLELYYGDVIERWQKVEHGLGFRLPGSLDDAASVLRPLVVPPSPLTRLLQAMADATRLTVPPEPPARADAAGEAHANSPTATGILIQQVLARLGEPSPPLGEPVEARFRPLARAVAGEGGAPPRLDRVLDAANELYHALPSPGAPPMPAQASQIKVQAERLAEVAHDLPAPLGKPLAALAERVEGMAEVQVLVRINDEYRAKVMPFCRQATAGRFPFSRGSAVDASLADMGRLFGTGGLFDQFIDQQLAPYVDTAQRPWRWLQPIGSHDGALAPFEIARRLRDGLFAGGTVPRAGFTLKPVGLDGNAKRVDLDLDGQTVSYARGGRAEPVHLDWPSPSGSRRVQLSFVPRGWWTKPVTKSKEGPWSWLRLLHEAGLVKQGRPDLYSVTLAAGPHRASFQLEADSVDNPFDLEPFQRFRCPGGL
jgi:type VI secretion system protein ImpL